MKKIKWQKIILILSTLHFFIIMVETKLKTWKYRKSYQTYVYIIPNRNQQDSLRLTDSHF